MVIRSERFVNLVMYPGLLTISGSIEVLLLEAAGMTQSMSRVAKWIEKQVL